MKKQYIIKPFKENPELQKLDNKKRAKIEEKTGKLTDSQWFYFKNLSRKRTK